MEYYLVMRKDEIIPFAAKWVEIEEAMLNEMSQKAKDKWGMDDLTHVGIIRKKK